MQNVPPDISLIRVVTSCMALTIADLWTVEKDALTFADDFVQIAINIKQIFIVLINNKKVNWLQNQLGNV